MKKILVLLVVGLILVGAGAWWYLHTTENPFNSTADIPPVQELEMSRDSLAGSVLISTTEGLRLLDPITGQVSNISSSFDRITAPTEYWGQTADGEYWLFMTQETTSSDTHTGYSLTEGESQDNTTTMYNWYVVNWPEKLLQRLDETLSVSFLQDKIWYAVTWGSDATVAGAFVAPEKPAVARQPYTLITLNMKNLQLNEFGVLSAEQLDVIGLSGAGLQTELFARVKEENSDTIIRRSSNSLQNTTISVTGGNFMNVQNSHGTHTAQYIGESVELLDLTQPDEILGTIEPLQNTEIGATQWWSSSGDVFALNHRDISDKTQHTVVFYSDIGTSLLEVPTVGSTDVVFSADGRHAVITATQDTLTTQDDTTLATKNYYFVSIYDAELTPISTVPENTKKILGVL